MTRTHASKPFRASSLSPAAETIGAKFGTSGYQPVSEDGIDYRPRARAEGLTTECPKLREVDQDVAIRLRVKMLPAHAPHGARFCIMPPSASGATSRIFGAQNHWRAHPLSMPGKAEQLIAAAAPHLQSLLIFLLGTGARMAEAIYLDWRDVDLVGARAIFWADRTKAGKRRNAALPPRVIAALANLPHRQAPVFLTDRGRPYADRRGKYGGQIKTGFRLARRRAGLEAALSPHDLRHTWASSHYAVHRDLLALRTEGG